MPKLHNRLRGVIVRGSGGRTINLYQRASEIKKQARSWLEKLGPNGFEHSERIEVYLNKLTEHLPTRQLNSGEAFTLLSAAYMHDIGRARGKRRHAERSKTQLRGNPGRYLLGDFYNPRPKSKVAQVADAVGIVCGGHAQEKYCPLQSIPDRFPDANLSPDRPMNLRLLVAFLRFADEADDPYTRVEDDSSIHFRAYICGIDVGPENIIWRCDRYLSIKDKNRLSEEIRRKNELLDTAIAYVYAVTYVERRLILDVPNVKA